MGVVWVWVCVGVGVGEGVGVGVLLSRRHRGAASMRSSKRAQWRHETDSVSIAEYARCCLVAQWWVWGGVDGVGGVGARGRSCANGAPSVLLASQWALSELLFAVPRPLQLVGVLWSGWWVGVVL